MKKRLLSLTLAILMVMGMTTMALADTAEGSEVGELPVDTENAPKAVDVEGSGEMAGILEKDITQILLPTAKALDFYIDPMGLLAGAGTDGGYFVYDEATSEGGAIVQKGAPAPFINESGYALQVDLKFTFTPGADAKALTAIAAAGTFTGSDASAMVYGYASSTKVTDYGDAFTPVETTGTDAQAVDLFTENALSFAFPKAKYAIIREDESTFTPQFVPGTGSGNAIVIGGKLNDAAPSYAGKELSVKCEFTATRPGTSPKSDDTLAVVSDITDSTEYAAFGLKGKTIAKDAGTDGWKATDLTTTNVIDNNGTDGTLLFAGPSVMPASSPIVVTSGYDLYPVNDATAGNNKAIEITTAADLTIFEGGADYKLAEIEWFVDGVDQGLNLNQKAADLEKEAEWTKGTGFDAGKLTVSNEALKVLLLEDGLREHKFTFYYTHKDDPTDWYEFTTKVIYTTETTDKW